jgi:hypothetical protein
MDGNTDPVLIVRVDQVPHGNNDVEDATAVFSFVVCGSVNNSMRFNFNFNGLAQSIAQEMCVDAPLVVVKISNRNYSTVNSTQTPMAKVSVAVKFLAPAAPAPLCGINAVRSVEVLYMQLVSVLATNASLTPTLQSFVSGAAATALKVSSLAVNFTLSSGLDLSTAGVATPLLSVPHLLLVPDMVAISYNGITPKSKWTAIPLLLLFPVFIVFGTYRIYMEYLLVRSDELMRAKIEEDARMRNLWNERKTKFRKLRTHVGDLVVGAAAEVGVEFIRSGADKIVQGAELILSVPEKIKTFVLEEIGEREFSDPRT